jgi:hypothetical protein
LQKPSNAKPDTSTAPAAFDPAAVKLSSIYAARPPDMVAGGGGPAVSADKALSERDLRRGARPVAAAFHARAACYKCHSAREKKKGAAVAGGSK